MINVRSLPNLAKKYGVSYRQICHWVKSGYIKPDQLYPGAGTPHTLSQREEKKLEIMARLVRAGITPDLAHQRAMAPTDYIGPGVRLVIESLEVSDG